MRGEIVTAIIGGIFVFSCLGCVSKKTYLRDLENARDIGVSTGKLESQSEIIRLKKERETFLGQRDRCADKYIEEMTKKIEAMKENIELREKIKRLTPKVKCKQTGVVPIQANPKGIQTPLRDSFNERTTK